MYVTGTRFRSGWKINIMPIHVKTPQQIMASFLK
jgi:hypothetical protein